MSHINQGFAGVPVYQLDADQHTTTTNWYAGNQANQALQGFVFTWENEDSDLLNNPIKKQHDEEKREEKNKEEAEEVLPIVQELSLQVEQPSLYEMVNLLLFLCLLFSLPNIKS